MDPTKGIIEKDSDWDLLNQEAHLQMRLFDSLPKSLQSAMNDTGQDYAVVEAWWRHCINTMPILKRGDPVFKEKAAEMAATIVRELTAKAFEQLMAEDAAELEESHRNAPAARRRP